MKKLIVEIDDKLFWGLKKTAVEQKITLKDLVIGKLEK